MSYGAVLSELAREVRRWTLEILMAAKPAGRRILLDGFPSF
jgi:hypothetical protein